MSHPNFKYKPLLFSITAKSNLHVGSGGENYGIIDNMIQRDPATNIPCINASSIKGALRDFFSHYITEHSEMEKTEYSKMERFIFGNPKKEEDKDPAKQEYSEGNYKFLQGDLASIPVPQEDVLFKLKTSQGLINHCAQNLDFLQLNLKTPPNGEIFGNGCKTIDDTEFIELISDYKLPVIARNKLIDGKSDNLWYEQVLPRETRLYFVVLYPDYTDNTEQKQYLEIFIELIEKYPVQIGANASVGYGYCEIKCLNNSLKTTDNEAN